jgi:hypothetical protein
MKRVFLLRGLPGSGKTTLAQALVGTFNCVAEFFEADHYMINSEGVYEFQPDRLKDCHESCLMHYRAFLKDNVFSKHALAIVSNTFTQQWEMVPYIDAAQQAGFQVTTLIVENRHGSESIHVDMIGRTIDKMMHRFEIQLKPTHTFSLDTFLGDEPEPEMPPYPEDEEPLCPECGAEYPDDCTCTPT